MRDNTVINVKNVSMRFNLDKERVDSFKEFFIKKLKGQLRYEEFFALRDIDLCIQKGEKFGIVGLNGSGKSTLLKIIAGVYKPTAGSVKVRGVIAPLIELGAGFDPNLTGRENVFLNGCVLGYSQKFIEAHYEEIVEFAELRQFMDVPIKNYSSGMVSRLAFAVATIVKPDILISDEVLSVGDFLFTEKCEKRIESLVSGGTTVILVSHSIEQVERICDRVAWIKSGNLEMLGDTEEVCAAYKNSARG